MSSARGFRWRGAIGAAGLTFVLALGAASIRAQEGQFFRIGAAGTGGSFFEIGGVIAGAISKPPGAPPCERGGSCGVPGLVAVAQATQGSVDNIRLVGSGQIESGIAQSDIVAWAYAGTDVFRGNAPMRQLRAIASLFPERLQLVVRADGPIETLSDLKGRRISLGELESGTLVDSRVLLAAAGLAESDVVAEFLRPATAAVKLKEGAIEGFFLIGGVPVPAIRDLAAAVPIRLVPISDDVLSRMQKHYGLYRRAVIPADAYPGIDIDTPSIGFHAIWVVTTDSSEDLIFAVTKALWSEATRRLLDAYPIGRQVRLAGALEGLPIPLHPGARRFYREAGLLIESDTAPAKGD